MKSNSWFIAVKKILWKYKLEDISFYSYLDNPITKLKWKNEINKVVNEFWHEEISSAVQYYEKIMLYEP